MLAVPEDLSKIGQHLGWSVQVRIVGHCIQFFVVYQGRTQGEFEGVRTNPLFQNANVNIYIMLIMYLLVINEINFIFAPRPPLSPPLWLTIFLLYKVRPLVPLTITILGEKGLHASHKGTFIVPSS